MFKKILIANRGAIAVRIEKTLRKMNVSSVAIYSKADRDSLHVANADEAVCLGSGTVLETYLNQDEILKIAKDLGVDAIHPGYGFLSENRDFAKKCAQQGISFIGPTPEQMEMFGLKHLAREIAAQANVPMLEGSKILADENEAVEVAENLGYPVIIKSTAGGGGIGMRVCENQQALKVAYEACGHLAENNFSNSGLYLEKYLPRARHIEVQIFGNEYGEIVTLAERDCSVQRRNQKVVEECPAFALSDKARTEIHKAAKELAQKVGYRSAGTVEFLYDDVEEKFYFLEVNTRLQVEHGVTEEVVNVDIVEWMIKEACGELKNLQSLFGEVKGCSIQSRIYAEDPMGGFLPSTGKIDKFIPPENCRIETWVKDNVVVSPNYDPMLAKVIVWGENRGEAVAKMAQALTEMKVYGITTNIDYLKGFISSNPYKNNELFTHILDDFKCSERKIEVLDGGVQTSIQDYPGRLKYWDIGIPPSGAMDNVNFRIGNAILANDADAVGLEMTLKGGKYLFRDHMTICLTGADMSGQINDESVPMYQAIDVNLGDVLTLDKAINGMRTYLLVKGGLDVPKYLGSSSTFALGGFGGLGGRCLRTGDTLSVLKAQNNKVAKVPKNKLSKIDEVCEIRIVPGPHCTEEFLKSEYLEELVETPWEVNFNSDRTGVRLMGPVPLWSREDGGEAGLHPSNIHDTAYAVGTIDLTGDMPIILGPDGPSLGGFVCPATIPTGELWKIGQLAPGNKVKFRLISLETADKIREDIDSYIENIENMANESKNVNNQSNLEFPTLTPSENLSADYPILLSTVDADGDEFKIRCAGDQYVLCEYGEMEIDMRLRIKAHALKMQVEADETIPLIDCTPGIRSLQIHIDSKKMSVIDLAKKMSALNDKIGDVKDFKVKSRKIKLPLSWDDPAAKLAVERYHQNVRHNAPWCPDNKEFIRRINGLDSINDVKNIIFSTSYMVMGLGDVYLGAPVCIPLNQCNRLVTTKYNPARTWTPENAVGIGGAYLGIYGMEGPGGYQIFGRTIQTWNSLMPTKSFKEGKPWLLDFFDQIEFYPVSADELLKLRDDFLRDKFNVEIEDTIFDYGEYLDYLKANEVAIKEAKLNQTKAFNVEKQMWKDNGLDSFEVKHENHEVAVVVADGSQGVMANMPGSLWKILVKKGDKVKKNKPIAILESMKMEFEQLAPCDGIIEDIYVNVGEEINAGQIISSIKL